MGLVIFQGGQQPGAPWAFYADVIYRVIEGKVEPGLLSGLDTADLSLNGLGVSAGVAYRF